MVFSIRITGTKQARTRVKVAHAPRDSGYFFTWKSVLWLILAHSITQPPRKESANIKMAFRKFLPMFDRVLVERLAAETVTKGGIMLPEKSQGKVLQATVVATGPGSTNKDGKVVPVSVKVGEKVLLPEYGGTKVSLDDKEYFLFRDGDILGKYVD
ncbi:10 kDa heat shock protein, mitochondrial [Paramormyrops kingsleyae]|nr:10 kDa heat shock protein, mitochondrial [Paramormyrops kingsleyae]